MAGPKRIGSNPQCLKNPTHEDIRQALEAQFAIPLEENRTSNFAIPITKEWIAQGGTLDKNVPQQEIYCQVDVHACTDEDEYERIVFLHGFGDLGMILGLIARNCGFSLGTKGLKVSLLLKTIVPWKIKCWFIDTYKIHQPPISPVVLLPRNPPVF